MQKMSNRPSRTTTEAITASPTRPRENTTKDIRPERRVEPQSAFHRVIVSRFTACVSVGVMIAAAIDAVAKAVQ